MRYKVHNFPINMKKDQQKLEEFLNGLRGEVVSVIPNVVSSPLSHLARVSGLLIVEGRP